MAQTQKWLCFLVTYSLRICDVTSMDYHVQEIVISDMVIPLGFLLKPFRVTRKAGFVARGRNMAGRTQETLEVRCSAYGRSAGKPKDLPPVKPNQHHWRRWMWEGKTNGGILHCHYPRERKATKVSALSPEILTFQIFAPRRTVLSLAESIIQSVGETMQAQLNSASHSILVGLSSVCSGRRHG